MLILLRSYAFTAYMVLTIVIMGIVCLPAALWGKRAARAVVKLWARMMLGALKTVSGVSYTVRGAENIPQGGALVAANHQSMWETIALYALLPEPVMILKKELMAVPVYGWWARATGNIAVDRKAGAKALRAMRAAAREAIENGEQVTVFPEGTRIAPGARAPYQPGVAGVYAAAGAPCAPVSHDSGRFWRHPGVRKEPGEITLTVGRPIEPGLDRKSFMATLQARIDGARPDLDGAAQPQKEPSHA